MTAAVFAASFTASAALADNPWQSLGSYAQGDVSAEIVKDTSAGELVWHHYGEDEQDAGAVDKLTLDDAELPIEFSQEVDENELYMIDMDGALLLAEMDRSENRDCRVDSGLYYVNDGQTHHLAQGCTESFIDGENVKFEDDKIVIKGQAVPYEGDEMIELEADAEMDV